MKIVCDGSYLRASISDGLGLVIHGYEFHIHRTDFYNDGFHPKLHFKILNLGNTPPQTQHPKNFD